jgi:anti-anti-sigma factor
MEFESRLTIDEREIDGVILLVLVGAITLDDGDLVFGKQIQALAAAGRIRIVADMQRVTYIDSAGLAMMAARLNMVRRQGGDIRLLHLNDRGRRLLHVLKLPSTFEIFDDEELALRSFESRPSA